MTTDFTYGEKQILAGGPIKPSGKDMPVDARTRVESYADIASIPNPHVGLKITVKVDETNNNKMTDYIVKSLKADSIGIANSLIDEVVRYVDYLGANGQDVDTNNFATKEELGLKADKTELHSHINKTVLDGITSTNVDNWNNKVDKVEGKTLTTNDYTNEEKQTVASLKATVGDTSSGLVKDVKDLKTNGVSQDNINVAIENYLREHPVQSGATAEQAAQIQANKTAIGDSNSGLIKEVNDIKNTELQNLNTAIQTLETLVGVDETLGDKSGLPSGDANVIASINRIDRKTTIGNGLTTEQAQQLQTAYEHSQSVHIQSSDIPTKVSQLENDSQYTTSSEVSEIVGNINVNNLSSPLKGLVWNVLGDSITAGSGTTKQYHKFISERTGCVVNNYGLVSSTLSTQFKDQWTSNPMCERIDSMAANADIITLFGGINDCSSDCVVGDINSFDTDTIYGALNVLIDKLLYRFPYSIIATIIPVKSSRPSYDQNIYEQICNAILEVSNKYSIPCLDLRNLCGINPFDDFMREIYMPDSLHPNINGHRKMSYVIQNFLESIVFKYPKVEATNMSLPSTYSIGRNNTEKLSLTWSPEDTSQKSVTWESSNPDVVTVDYKGNITGLTSGTSTITCTNNNNNSLTTTCLVTVGEENVTGVTLDKTSHSLLKGESLDIHATIIPDNASNKNVTWSVDNEYCTITPNGLTCSITAVTEGISTITVATEDGNYSATCSISVTGERVINDDLVDYTSLKEKIRLSPTDGTEISDNNCLTTDFINIEPDTEYIVGKNYQKGVKYTTICFYDENGEFINGSNDTNGYYIEITSPSNARKMKFTAYTTIVHKYSLYAYKKPFTPTIPLNINLYDGELLQAGAYYDGEKGGIIQGAGIDLTSYIPVEPTITVEMSVGYGANGFDENKNWCCGLDLANPIPYGVYYILINLPAGKANELTVVRKS